MKTNIASVILLIISLSLVFASQNKVYGQEASRPSIPEGIGYEFVPEYPSVGFPLPAITYANNNVNESSRYSLENPIVEILYGFNSIWSLSDSAWQNGGANGSGPDSFENAEIRNELIWKENIQYVVDVTKNRTEAEALAAYYDDRRDKCFSVIDGFGPLADAYIEGSGAVTKIDYSNDASFEVNFEMANSPSDVEYSGLGNSSSKLSKLSNIVYLLRQRSPASTNGSKYFYSSPRPWRMNDSGEVVPVDENADGETDLETIGGIDFEKYETSVQVVPALKVCRRKASDGRRKDGGYPSGHTNAGYLAAIGWAYAVPERFSELFTRASQLGENRILAGMHSPLDVIGGRIQAQAIAAFAFSREANKNDINDAYKKAGEYFGKLASEKGQTLYEYAHSNDTSDWADNEKNKKIFRERLAYRFSQINEKDIPPAIPEGAEVLLETRQPYLTKDQRRAVLYTTALESGYPVLDESNGWGRLDYVKAADGYGAFLGDVTVSMDSSKGRFNAHDCWRNDISGEGLLTKDGTGTLTLTGNNSYTGGTIVKDGVLEAKSSNAFGSGDIYIQTGTVLINADSCFNIGGNLTIDDGTLSIVVDDEDTQVITEGVFYIDGGDLRVDFSEHLLETGADFTLAVADTIVGCFTNVIAKGCEVTIQYNSNNIVIRIESLSSNQGNDELPNESKLIGNYPNPFNPSTRIKYSIAEQSHVSLII